MFAFSSPTLTSHLFPVNSDFFLIGSAGSMPALRFARNHSASPRATTPNIPVPSVAQDRGPAQAPDQDRAAANSDRPCPAFLAWAASLPALPAADPDCPAAPAPADAQ